MSSSTENVIMKIEETMNVFENVVAEIVSIVAPEDLAVVTNIQKVTTILEQEVNLLMNMKTTTVVPVANLIEPIIAVQSIRHDN